MSKRAYSLISASGGSFFVFEVVSSSIATAAIAQGVAAADTTTITVTTASTITTNFMNFKSLSHLDFIYYTFLIN